MVSPRSLATRSATEMAATRRGCVHTMLTRDPSPWMKHSRASVTSSRYPLKSAKIKIFPVEVQLQTPALAICTGFCLAQLQLCTTFKHLSSIFSCRGPIPLFSALPGRLASSRRRNSMGCRGRELNPVLPYRKPALKQLRFSSYKTCTVLCNCLIPYIVKKTRQKRILVPTMQQETRSYEHEWSWTGCAIPYLLTIRACLMRLSEVIRQMRYIRTEDLSE